MQAKQEMVHKFIFTVSPFFKSVSENEERLAQCVGHFLLGTEGRCCRMAKLTAKQQRFCDEYLIDLNATQAAIRAGYSAKTADQQGSRMLTNVKVQQEIAEKMAERSKRTGINQDRVLQEIAKLALVNIDDVVDLDTGRVRETATKEDLACIQSIKIKPTEFGTEREIKFYDKKGSLELVGKHLGMFKDKAEVEVVLPIFTDEDKLED